MEVFNFMPYTYYTRMTVKAGSQARNAVYKTHRPTGRYHHPLNPLHLLNPLHPEPRSGSLRVLRTRQHFIHASHAVAL